MSECVRVRSSTEKYFHSCSPYEFLISALIETKLTTFGNLTLFRGICPRSFFYRVSGVVLGNRWGGRSQVLADSVVSIFELFIYHNP